MPPLSKSIMPPSTARLQIAHRGLRLAFAVARLRQSPRDCEGGDTGLRIMADRIARSTPRLRGLTYAERAMNCVLSVYPPPEGVDHLCLRVGEQVRSSPPEGVDLHGSCDRKIRGRSTPPEGVDREEER